MKYIVFWILSVLVPDPCPDQVKVDDFGRTSFYGCTVFHAHFEYKEHQKEFYTREEAFAFYERALKESKEGVSGYNIGSGRVSDVKIDSVEVK